MTLVNLTKNYHNNSFHPFSRMAGFFQEDLYYAENLKSIEEHFAKHPPKKEFSGPDRQALILIYDLEIKRVWPDYFDENAISAQDELDGGFNTPNFYIKDLSTTRAAYWMGGNFSDYMESQEKFSFNRETFIKIPKSRLRYRHNEDRGTLGIIFLDTNYTEKEKDKSRNRFKKLGGMIRGLTPTTKPNPLPEPA